MKALFLSLLVLSSISAFAEIRELKNAVICKTGSNLFYSLKELNAELNANHVQVSTDFNITYSAPVNKVSVSAPVISGDTVCVTVSKN